MNKKLLYFMAILGLAGLASSSRISMAQAVPDWSPGRPFVAEVRHAAISTATSTTSDAQGIRANPDAVAQSPAKTKSYRFRSVDYTDAGSEVYDFNGKTAVGMVHETDIAFTFRSNTDRLLNIPGATQSIAHGINASDNIVGVYLDSADHSHGFQYDGSKYIILDVPGVENTVAWDINDAGLIVGQYIDSNSAYQGFLYDKGTFTTITIPGATNTSLFGINSNGDIVGSYVSAGIIHGFLLRNGGYSSLDYPQASVTVAVGINNVGTIAGYYRDQQNLFHGFTYAGGLFTQVDVSGAKATFIYRINNHNNVVGTISDSLNESHGIIGH